MPLRQRFAREQAHRQRGRADDAYPFLLQKGQQSGKADVVQAVVAIGQDGIDFGPIQHYPKNLQRKAGNAHKTGFPRALHFPQSRNGFVDYLVEGTEFNVVALDQVYVVQAEPLEAFIDAALYPLSRKVELSHVVPADLGSQEIAVAWNSTERPAEHFFGFRQPVVRRGVHKIDAKIERGADGAIGFGLFHRAKSAAHLRSAEGERGHAQAGFSKSPVLHFMSW